MRIFISGAIIIPLILCVAPASSQTEISGRIPAELKSENSPYHVVGDINLKDGTYTHIEPGVTLVFMGKYQIRGEGDLFAYGTKEDRITFTSLAGNEIPGAWRGIAVDQCELSYCDIMYSDTAVRANDITLFHSRISHSAAYGVFMSNRTNLDIVNTEISNNGNYAVYCLGTPGGSIDLYNNIISENGGGIYLRAVGKSPTSWVVGSGHKATLTYNICDNIIASNLGYGIFISSSGNITGGHQSSYKSDITVKATVNNNLLYKNESAIWTNLPDISSYLIELSSLLIIADQNTLWDNGNRAILVDDSVHFDISNSSIYGFGDKDSVHVSPASKSVFQYCNLKVLTEGIGNLSQDPQYQNPTNGDFHLAEGSPLIDAGDTDQVDEDGTRRDIGHSTFHQLPLTPRIIGCQKHEYEYFDNQIPFLYTLQWLNQGENIKYHIQIEDQENEQILVDSLIDQNYFQFTGFKPEQSLRLEIRAINLVGDTSSRHFNFIKMQKESPLEAIYSRALFYEKTVRDVPYVDDNHLVAIVSSPEPIENEKWSIAVMHIDSSFSDKGVIDYPPDWQRFDNFGKDVSMFDQLLITSSPGDDSIAENSGKAFIYSYIGDEWRLISSLKPQSVEEGDNFGNIVRIDSSYAYVLADGNELVKLYIYENDNLQWTLDTFLTISKENHSRWRVEQMEVLQGEIYLGISARNDEGSYSEIQVLEKKGVWQTDNILVNDTIDISHMDLEVDTSGIYLGHLSYEGRLYHYDRRDESFNLKQEISSIGTISSGALGENISVYGNNLIAGNNSQIYLFRREGSDWKQEHRLWTSGAKSIHMLENEVLFSTGTTIYKLPIKDFTSPTITLKMPGDGRKKVLHKPILYWNEAVDPTLSFLQLSRDSSFNQAILDDTVSGVELELPILESGETYFWRMKSKSSDWSSAYSFKVEQAGKDTILPFRVDVRTDEFGKRVLVVDSFLFVGAPATKYGDIENGIVYVFKRNSKTSPWEPWQLIESETLYQQQEFGSKLYWNGTSLLIGGNTEKTWLGDGMIHCYTLKDDQWQITSSLDPSIHFPGSNYDFNLRFVADSSRLVACIDGDRGNDDAFYTFSNHDGIWAFESVNMNPDTLELDLHPAFSPRFTLSDGYLYVSGANLKGVEDKEYSLSYEYKNNKWELISIMENPGIHSPSFHKNSLLLYDGDILYSYQLNNGQFVFISSQRFETINSIVNRGDYLYTSIGDYKRNLYKKLNNKFYYLTTFDCDRIEGEWSNFLSYYSLFLDDTDLYLGTGRIDLPMYYKTYRSATGVVFYLGDLDAIELDTTISDPALFVPEQHSPEVDGTVTVYPNPVHDHQVTLEFQEPVDGTLRILDGYGRIILEIVLRSKEKVMIPATSLVPGVCYLQVIYSDGRLSTGTLIVY